MASRSFKASSYLTSSNRRASSSSSISSEDSFIAAIRNKTRTSTITGGPSSSNATGQQESCGGVDVVRPGLIPGPGIAAGTGTDSHAPRKSRHNPPKPPPPQPPLRNTSEATVTPTSTRSRPIAIELPSAAIAARKRSLPVYTPDEPLSARGDLPGGYFPFHEDPSIRSYKPHPFHHSPPKSKSKPKPKPKASSTPTSAHPYTMSSSSRDTTPRPHTLPEATMAIPMGKYHPSNYKITPVTSSSPSTSAVAAAAANLSMPSASSPNHLHPSSSTTKHHNRNLSDVKRKLQQYQRDMIAQARLASTSATASSASGIGPTALVGKPISPRLLPMGSPDELSAAMTPLELGDGAGEGYLEAKSLGPAEGRESEMVGRMLRMEEERRRREGQSSPVARV